MGRHFNQNESRSELQQRIAAELRAKAAERAKREGSVSGTYFDSPDGVEDAAYMQGTKPTTTLSWAWLFIFVFAVAVFGYFIYLVVTA